MDQYIGKMLDNRYEILERIGVGGMAVVYKARCHRLNRLVAIKVLKPELASDAEFRRRFQTESQAVAMLSHVNIVGVYDVCHSDGLNYIVMELIEGMTLKQYMQKRGTPLKWQETLHFILQVLRALDHAHHRGIIHRDIKPQNILVLRDGTIKVADFGIARLTSDAQSTMTMTQEALGSVHYISPEQAKGSHIDGRSDLYSVGVMLYEMLTGRLPFEGESPVLIAIQHIKSIPIQPRELNADIPLGLEGIVLKAMAQIPTQRYSSAMDMLNAITDFQKNPNAVPEPTIRIDAVDEPTRVISAGSVRDLSASTEDEYEDDDEEDIQEEDGVFSRLLRRFNIPPMAAAVTAILVFVVGIGFFLFNFISRAIFPSNQEYIIPSLEGYTIEELEKRPDILGDFKIEVGEPVANEKYEEGQICIQIPEAETKVKDKKTTIKVSVSKGKEPLTMPDVAKWDARRALAILQDDMKLQVKQEYEFSTEVEKGYVISFTPTEGTNLKEGNEVTIVISKGKEVEKITVGDYTNLSLDQVKSQVEIQGLKVGSVKEYYSDEYAAGRVIWQSIDKGTMVEPGTAIDFQVSLGPEAKPTPTPPSEPVRKTITVDFKDYTGNVRLKVTMGTTTLYDGTWDTSKNYTQEVRGTGTQKVSVYINDSFVYSYDLTFSQP